MNLQLILNSKTTKILSTAALGLLAVYIQRIWSSYSFFKKRGLKTPPYRFLFGNHIELRKNKKPSEVVHEWTKLYGKTYGYYEGHQPVLVTSDLDLIHEILVKQFSNYSAKKKSALSKDDEAGLVAIFSATKGRWKRMRNIMNPTFSTAKLKQLEDPMRMCSDRLIARIEENAGNEIPIKKMLKQFTLDTIWNCGFGMDRNMQTTNNGDIYIENVQRNAELFANFSLLMYLTTYFSEFRKYIIAARDYYHHLVGTYIGVDYTDALYILKEEIFKIVDLRCKEQTRKNDYLQLLLEAYAENENDVSSMDKRVDFSNLKYSKKLVFDEIRMNLTIFMIAGFETTSYTLVNILRNLALHPVEQERLRNEIDELEKLKDGKPTQEDISKLRFLDMVVKETLRMDPVSIPTFTRRCTNDVVLNGIPLPENTGIVFDIIGVHFDEETWGPVDPYQFYPLRFEDESTRHPCALLSFSQGPRQCLGKKFALMEIKLSIYKIFKDYNVLSNEDTYKPIEFFEGTLRTAINEVYVTFEKRLEN